MLFTKNQQFAILKKRGKTIAEVEFDKLDAQRTLNENIQQGVLNGRPVALKRYDSEEELEWLLQLRLEHRNIVKFL